MALNRNKQSLASANKRQGTNRFSVVQFIHTKGCVFPSVRGSPEMIERLSHVCDSPSSERTGFARACLTSCLKTDGKSERGLINYHTRQHADFFTAAVLRQCGRVVVIY